MFSLWFTLSLTTISLLFTRWQLDWFSAPKWSALYLSAFTCSLMFFVSCLSRREKKFLCPRILIDKNFYFLFTIWLLSAIGTLVTNHSAFFSNWILDWACFLVLSLFVYDHLIQNQDSPERFFKLIERSTLAAALPVGLYGFLQMKQVELFPDFADPGLPSSTFGVQNFAAEFYGAAALILNHSFRSKNQIREFVKPMVSGAMLALLYFTGCRGAILGFALTVTLLLALKIWSMRQVIIQIAISVFIVATFSLLFVRENKQGSTLSEIHPFNNPTVIGMKSRTTYFRLHRWANALRMIEDHPFGISPTGFEFNYIPYEESVFSDREGTEEIIIHKVHNGFLELFLDWGWIGGISSLVCLAWIMFKAFRIARNKRSEPLATLPLGIFIFIGVNAFFAFPMANAFPFFLAAILTGSLLHYSTSTKVQDKKIQSQYVALAALLGSLLIAALSSLYFFSKHVEVFKADDLKANERACKLFPENWRVCLRKAELEYFSNAYAASETTLDKMLSYQPHNFAALKLLAYVKLDEGKEDEACQAYRQFDLLFHNGSSLKEDFEKQCQPK